MAGLESILGTAYERWSLPFHFAALSFPVLKKHQFAAGWTEFSVGCNLTQPGIRTCYLLYQNRVTVTTQPWRLSSEKRSKRMKMVELLPMNSYHISSVIRQSFFSYLHSPKILVPSYKTDLDLWDCLGRVKLVLWQIS